MNQTSRTAKFVRSVKAIKYDIRGGKKQYVERQVSLETVVSDPREHAQEKMYQERLLGDLGEKDESMIGVCKMVTSSGEGIFFCRNYQWVLLLWF